MAYYTTPYYSSSNQQKITSVDNDRQHVNISQIGVKKVQFWI